MHPFIQNLIEASTRKSKSKINKKEPVTAEHLTILCSAHADSRELVMIRDLTMITLGFVGFLKFNELSAQTCKDIIFCQ